MKFSDLIKMALKNLNNRRTRTFLKVLGVVIGTTSIIVMLSIGFGFSRINRSLMGDVNLNVLNLERYDYSNMEEGVMPKESKTRNDFAVQEVSNVAHVKGVLPYYEGAITLKSGRYTARYAQLVALDPTYMEDFGYKINEGRLLTSKDNRGEVVFGSYVTKSFRDEKRPMANVSDKVKAMSSRIEVTGLEVYNSDVMAMPDDPNETKEYKEKLKVVGILEENMDDWQSSNSVFMSTEYFKSLYQKYYSQGGKAAKLPKEYSQIKVMVDEVENVEQVQEDIRALEYHPINFRAESLKAQNQQLMIVQIVFGAIGGIAFLVAAIGISNTMIMSIYERTKEIGVMKVIGASINDIKKLFLVEAGFIGLRGGGAGVILSLLIPFGINYFTKGYFQMGFGEDIMFEPKLSYIPIWLIIVALVFSTMVGVLSGYLPARKAMILSALDAIRGE